MWAALYLPAGQLVQLLALSGANLPEPQPLQSFEVAPVVFIEVPPAHATQLPWPASAWYEPALHTVHARAAAAANWPAPQVPQLVEPVWAENDPAAQSLQRAPPVSAWNVPAAQVPQLVEPVLSWKRPTAQAEQAVALNAEYEPVTQLAHTVAPAVSWNVPGAQAVHPTAFATENWPAPQVPQLVAPVAAWNLPAPQFRQEDSWVAGW